MPPKGKAALAPDPIPADAPTEEDEDGDGKIVFSIEVSGVINLPAQLETCISFGGACRPNRTEPAAPSISPSGWEFPRPHFIRKVEQVLFDDLCGRELLVSVRDAGNGNEVVGKATIDLMPLLHERTEVGGQLELKLEPDYAAMWNSTAEPVPAAASKKPDAKGKTPEPPGDDANEAPAPVADPDAPTLINVKVSVPALVGPAEDRNSWTKLTATVKGIYSLPKPLTALNGGDVENHPLKYQGILFGEPFGEGSLTKPVEEPPEAEEGAEPPPEPSEAEWRSLQEHTVASVSFKGGLPIVWYRGASFINSFQSMLNHVGGVWFYVNVEEKVPADPKKAGGEDLAKLTQQYSGKAWLDLRVIIKPGVHSAAAYCPLQPLDGAAGQEPTLQSSRTFVSWSLELSHEVTPPTPARAHTPMNSLLPVREGYNKFPPSTDAATVYRDAVKRTFEVVCQECAGGVRGGVDGAVEVLKDAGSYKGCKDDLRRTIIQVLRERVRKDTGVIPGRPLEDSARDQIMSNTYMYLTSTIAEIMDEMRESLPPKPEPEDADTSPLQTAQPEKDGFHAGSSRMTDGNSNAKSKTFWMPRGSAMQLSARSGTMGTGKWAGTSGMATPSAKRGAPPEENAPVEEEPPQNPVAIALTEARQVGNARKSLQGATDPGDRCKRLAHEAEILGNWERAAEQLQTRLLLPDFKSDPKEWLSYAKFCARARGRQNAAEEALVQARGLLDSGEGLTYLEVDLMLGCLLLDRGRHAEAIEIFRSWHSKDLAEPTYLFHLGLALFLAGEGEEGKPLLEATGKPREWFDGLDDDVAIQQKVASSRATDGPLDPAPFADALGQLLDFGLPSLAFTFLDQCGTLSEAELAPEPFALLDARASAMDGDLCAAVERLKPLLDSNQASREAWRLAGECYARLHEPEKALQTLQQAVSFEKQFEDAAVYIGLGSVLLTKKRWKQARDAFLRSIQYQATAEAWSGVGLAEYNGGDLQLAYEALCEANLQDNRRPKVWAQLCLLHLRLENWESADDSIRQCLKLVPDCEEALQQVASEYVRLQRQPAFAEAAARAALAMRESGQARGVLSEALGQQGRVEESVEASQAAIELLAHQPDVRGAVLAKALKLCEAVARPDLQGVLLEAQKAADLQYAERPLSAGG